MNFSLSELENLFYNIEEIIDYIEQLKLSSRKSELFLGNGDKICYTVTNESIAHLLGVNIPYLISTSIFKETNSFILLKRLCENPYKIHNLAKNKIINYNKLFSPFIQIKVDSFKKNIKMNAYETEFICKYDKTRAYQYEVKHINCDYIVVKKYLDEKFAIVYLVKQGNEYIPMSSQIFNNKNELNKELKNLIINQPITFISGITDTYNYYDHEKRFNLNLKTKLEKIEIMKSYKNKFNAVIDISEDYKYHIKKLITSRTNQIEDNDLIDRIVINIKEGKLLDEESFRDTNLYSIINAFNDFLCSNKINEDDSIQESYTKLKEDLINLKDKISKLQIENKNIIEENRKLIVENESIKSENDEFVSKQQKILEILKRPKN